MEQTDAWRTALRQSMKAQRAALDNASLAHAESAVAKHLAPEIAGHRNVAGYLAIRGELPVGKTLAQVRASGARTFLPVVNADSMVFVHVDENTHFSNNRFGIPEPEDISDTIAAAELDLVLVPLVAFDPNGNRLGMGGGFYDRTFESALNRPRLIGVAHSFQGVPELQAMPWDVPLDALVTESGLLS